MAPRLWCVRIACFLLLFFPRVGGADCPQVTITVDNDIPGSGYSEYKPENWLSRSVGSCSGTYRYLSHTVGDGTRTGKAIWQPVIPHNGWYRIVTSYRATENRTDNADYYIYDDEGGVTHIVINQRHSGDCTYAELGDFYCVVGGDCRLELDGTDDSQSDAADITTFELVDCDDPTPSGLDGGVGDGAVHSDGGTDTDGSAFDGATDGGLARDANHQGRDGEPPDAEYHGTPCGGGFMSGCGCRTLGGPINPSLPSSPLLWFLLILLCVRGYHCFGQNNDKA